MEWFNSATEWALRFPREILTLASTALAVFAAIIARRETQKQLRLEEERLRREIDQDTLAWGRNVIEAFADAGDLCDRMALPEFHNEQREIARRISALVDMGRMYFPNVDREGRGIIFKSVHGAHKTRAFRGYRPPILDALMFAFYEVRALGNTDVCQGGQSYIWECRRLFVSELQAHIDPDAAEDLINRYNVQDKAEQKEALLRASTLRAELETRRPGVIDESDVAPDRNGAA
ncbi:MAG: hypothetical protein AAGJ29_10785 [Pseudomonadota bacterium]